MTSRRVIVLGAAAVAVLIAAAAAVLVRPTSSYFAVDGRTEFGLPVSSQEPVLLGVHLLVPAAGETVEIKAVRPMMSEGRAPDVLLYDPGRSKELIGMIVESAWAQPEGGRLIPFAETAFGPDSPLQVVLRIAPGDAQVTLGPVAVDFTVDGEGLRTQVFEVYARACFERPVEYLCRPPAIPTLEP